MQGRTCIIWSAMDNIQKSAIKLVVLYHLPIGLIDKSEQSPSQTIGRNVIHIHEKRPLSPLFEGGNAKNLLKSRGW